MSIIPIICHCFLSKKCSDESRILSSIKLNKSRYSNSACRSTDFDLDSIEFEPIDLDSIDFEPIDLDYIDSEPIDINKQRGGLRL